MKEGNAELLARQLQGLMGGVAVEGQGRLAVLRVDEAALRHLALHRSTVVDAARQAGFTHVCLDLPA